MSNKHLGGHLNITHTDHGALNYIKNKFNINSMLDIGCGPGGQMQLAKQLGIESSIGIDGFPGPKRCEEVEITIHDFTLGPYEHGDSQYDLAWSCEFVEHVYEKYIPNFMNSFKKCKYVIMTYAPPGKGGHHHVNCREEKYWIEVFQNNNFVFDQKITNNLRKESSMKNNFIRNHGLFFINEGL